MSRRVVQVLDREIAFDFHAGQGTPMLLLHGIPGSRRNWEPLTPTLAADHTVIVPDLLGFGESAEPGEDFHATGQAAALLALLDTLGVARVHVAGFDFGGPIAVALYARAPERVLSLTLIATNLFTDTPIPGPLRLAPVPIVGSLFFRLAFGRLGLIGMWFAATRQRSRFPLRRFWADIASATAVSWTRRVFHESMRDLPGRYALVEATLARIRVPTLVVWGDHDPFFPVREGQRLAGAVRGAAFVVLPDTGHFIPMEEPNALSDLLLRHTDDASVAT